VRRTGLATIDAAMLYLLGVVFVSARHSRGPSLVTSVVTIAFFDFFFGVLGGIVLNPSPYLWGNGTP
jgi:K+-sensing histidine kinase KdpD